MRPTGRSAVAISCTALLPPGELAPKRPARVPLQMMGELMDGHAGTPRAPIRRGGGWGHSVPRPEEVLTPKQYLNYQHGRLLSGLVIFFGGAWAVIGLVMASVATPGGDPPGTVGAVFAAAGVVGGTAAWRGNRRWA